MSKLEVKDQVHHLQDQNQPMVSICCMTYNHEHYISATLDGFFSQKTNFEIEIIIHDDASTDGTSDILKKYEKESRIPIQCVYQTENQFLKTHVLSSVVFPMCKGKYIAYCEGDDFWTDPLKLQKQVDLLEAYPDASFCFSKVDLLIENKLGDHSYQHMDTYPARFGLEEYLDNYYPIPNLTKVFRKSMLTDYRKPEWNWKAKVRFMDNVMHMMDLMHGPALFLNEVTGTYRIQPQSLTRLAPKDDRWHNEEILLTHYHFIDHCPPEFIDKFKSIRAYHFEKLLNASIARKAFVQFLKDMLWYFTDSRSGSIIQKLKSIKKLFLTHSRSRSNK